MFRALTPSRRIRFGTFEVDPKSRELFRHGLKIQLQEQPFHILSMLLDHPGEVVTREELRQALWPGNTFLDFDQALNKAINKIRTALDDSAVRPHYIETLSKRGYRLIVPVQGTKAGPLISNASGEAKPSTPADNERGGRARRSLLWRRRISRAARATLRAGLALFGGQKPLPHNAHW